MRAGRFGEVAVEALCWALALSATARHGILCAM